MKLLAAVAALLAPLAAARAHWEIVWDRPPQLSPAQQRRVELLSRRLLETARAVPAGSEPDLAWRVSGVLVPVGQCARAEAALNAWPVDGRDGMFALVPPTFAFADRACARRMVARLAATPSSAHGGGPNPRNLYFAGALWRRLGEEARGEAAIAEAEGLLGGDPEAWEVRLYAMRIYHDTPLFGPALRRLAERALAEWPGPPRMHGSVGEELLRTAMQEGEDEVARMIAGRDPATAARTYAAARMTALFDEHLFAEGVRLGPEAGRFDWWNLPGAVAVAPDAFHESRAHLRDWSDRWPELLVALARAHLVRGHPDRAREALRTLREQASSAQWGQLAAARGIEALIDSPADPVAALDRQEWSSGNSAREFAYGELARQLAMRGRWAEFDRALAATRGTYSEGATLAQLPCLAGRTGTASIREALRRSRARFGADNDGLETGFWCLIERGHFDAAITLARWEGNVRDRLTMLIGAAQTPDLPVRARRRLAGLVLAEVDARRLWGDSGLVDDLAGSFEQLGDFATVERILRHARGPRERLQLLAELLRGYAPYSPMLDWIYGFARNA